MKKQNRVKENRKQFANFNFSKFYKNNFCHLSNGGNAYNLYDVQ